MPSDLARQPDHPADALFVQRWSPRALTGEPLDDATLLTLLEAARWAPSANNAQPWRFIHARPATPEWPLLLELLNDNNRRWAPKASALLVLLSRRTHLRAGERQRTPLHSHSLDAGAAWAYLALQADRLGWHTHAIGGFDRERAAQRLGIPDDYRVEILIAIGRRGDRDSLPADLREREWPNDRRPLQSLIAEGRFAFAD